MLAFGVVLLMLAAVVIVFGQVLYGNGVGAIPDEVGRDPAATRRGLTHISWSDLFGRMKTSINGMADAEASRAQKLTATGALCVMVGLIVAVLAVLAVVAALA